MTEVLSLGTGRIGDAVLDVGVGVGVLLLPSTSLLPLLFVLIVAAVSHVMLCRAEVILLARDGDVDGEGGEGTASVPVVVEDDEVVEEAVVRGGVGVLELEGVMNSFRTPAGTDIMGAAAVSRSFMSQEVGRPGRGSEK